MKLEIVERGVKASVSKSFLESLTLFFQKALVKKNIFKPSLNKKLIIAFVPSEEIQKLNKDFLKKSAVTDVLSFSPLEEEDFGELALCTEQIQLQAQKHSFTVEEETAYLVLHGILHLLGYEHEQGGARAEEMFKLQDDIFYSWQETYKIKDKR